MKLFYSILPPRNDDSNIKWVSNYTRLQNMFPPIIWYECKNNVRIRRKYYRGIDEIILYPSKNNDYMLALNIFRNIDAPITVITSNIFIKLKIYLTIRKYEKCDQQRKEYSL